MVWTIAFNFHSHNCCHKILFFPSLSHNKFHVHRLPYWNSTVWIIVFIFAYQQLVIICNIVKFPRKNKFWVIVTTIHILFLAWHIYLQKRYSASSSGTLEARTNRALQLFWDSFHSSSFLYIFYYNYHLIFHMKASQKKIHRKETAEKAFLKKPWGSRTIE